MDRKLAKDLYKLIDNYQNTSVDHMVIDSLNPKPLSGFHQWADSKEFEGGFLIENNNGLRVWLLFIEWLENGVFYAVIYPENKSGPVAEIHKIVSDKDESLFEWRYKPSKQDGMNEKRKEYFEKYFLSLEVYISVPSTVGQVRDFLNEIISLSENRQKADTLDKDTPDFRDGFPEGKVKERLHKQRERNTALIKLVKREVFAKSGKLECECCGFDFEKKYGDIGREFIEAHHTLPVSELHEDGEETKIEHIALVCSNCHRMLHRRRPWLNINELKKLIKVSS